MTERVVGIIGGAGVVAAVALVARIEELVTQSGATLDQQHPEIILLQATKAPSRSMWIEGRGPSFVPAYLDAADRLRQGGAEVLAMSCNTAHVAFPELQEGSELPFINLIAEALAELARVHPEVRKVGLLCSDGTRIGRIYETQAQHENMQIEFLHPNPDIQALVTKGIRGVKRGLHRNGQRPSEPETDFTAAAEHLADRGAEVILLGCTEIPLAFGASNWRRKPVIDTIDVLARACLRESGVQYGAY